jgi:glycogen operon protein
MTPVGKAGHSSPLGATVVDGGVNFSLFSRSATGVELLLFDRDDDARPARVLRLDPVTNHTYHYWHVGVPGVQPGARPSARPAVGRAMCAPANPTTP